MDHKEPVHQWTQTEHAHSYPLKPYHTHLVGLGEGKKTTHTDSQNLYKDNVVKGSGSGRRRGVHSLFKTLSLEGPKILELKLNTLIFAGLYFHDFALPENSIANIS